MEEVKKMLRVNLAGEYGAMRIYQGQIAAARKRVGTDDSYLATLQHMQQQELEHLNFFQYAVVKNRARPTILQPLWHVCGYALGYLTASMGEKTAMACTVAVEEVIDKHYTEQLVQIDAAQQPELYQVITKFKAEELQHRDTALQYSARSAPLYHTLHAVIQAASKAAIWLSTRV
jgi:ubiquinone biosynthesis monooxygenase Coq7